MNKRNLFIIILTTVLSMVLLSGCITTNKPVKKEKATKAVTEALGYEPEFIDSCVEKSSYKKNKKNYYYEFEDADGMRFTFSSELESQGLDGATFYYAYVNKVNYKRRLLPFYHETMEALCQKYNLGFERSADFNPETSLTYDAFGNEEQFGASIIFIDGYSDLEKAADLILEILDTCRIHAKESVLFDSDIPNVSLIVRIPTVDGKVANVTTFYLLRDDEMADRDAIYQELYKAYIEVIKTGKIPNDVSEDVLSSTCPEVLHGVFDGTYYDLWGIELVRDDDPERPEYSFEIEYNEPKEREDYTYYEGYYTKGFKIYDIIAQLGGTCTFHERVAGRNSSGFEGTLSGDTYQFGFENSSMDTIYIVRNGKEYLFNTEISNPANNTYSFTIDKETFEEIFGVTITYNFTDSTFIVEK